MSSIDAVIAEARRAGGFSERKRFTLARTQAIQKLRQFALADPAAYVLELIQSAIANGASWIEVVREPTTMTLAYIGGGIPEDALARLFDFLFASKDRADLGYLRELAIGINALMIQTPSKIIIESGDGTRAGTTRMELLAGEDRFDVGRPDHALAGTFIRAEGLRRDKGGDRELLLIETRCLAAPVPILYNGQAIFGHSTRRIPGIIGYRKHMSFDEGDLYGTIGVPSEHEGRAEFALLTRGVLIESVEHALVPDARLGGVVCFDGLRKTADHARVVRDDHFEELWLRLRPYARALLGGQGGHDGVVARPLGASEPLAIKDLRAWLRAAGRVVLAPPNTAPGTRVCDDLQAIAAALQAELLCARHQDLAALRILGGSGVEIHTVDVDRDSGDREFFARPLATPPPRPWLVQPVEVAPVSVAALRPESVATELAGVLGEAAELRMRVYTPAASEHRGVTEVVFHSCGRELARHETASAHAGHVLVVELPSVAPSQLRAAQLPPTAPGPLAEACLHHAAPALAEAADRVLAGLVDPTAPLTPLERHRALAALARSAAPRLRRSPGPDGAPRPTIHFSLVEPGPPGVDLLGLRLFTSASGRPLCARELGALITAAGGWLLAVPGGAAPTPASAPEPTADLEHVLLMDPGAGPLLQALVGEAAYLLVEGTCSKIHGPAAMDAAGRSYTAEQITAALQAGRTLTIHYGHAPPGHEAGGDEPPDELWMPPWAWLQLAHLGPLLPAFDFHLADAEAREHGDELAFIAAAPVEGGEVDGLVGVPLAEPGQPGVVIVDEQLRAVHHFRDLAHDFGVVGLLRLRGAWSPTRADAIGHAIARAVRDVYDDLLARVPTMDPHGRAFARATVTMLGYAGRRLGFVTDAHGQVRVPAVTAVADRVLALPLFPGRRGLPLAAWQLIRRFAATRGDLEAALAELDLAATPAVLRAWLAEHLARARIAREPAAPTTIRASDEHLELTRDGRVHPIADPDPGAPIDEVTLATTLEYWLHQLRPDLAGPARRPWDLRGHVWIDMGDDGEAGDGAAVTGDGERWSVGLRRRHWLLRWAAATGRRDREAIAWLLLACFARINEVFDAVTNHHESQFQRAVADALAQGRIALVTPRLE